MRAASHGGPRLVVAVGQRGVGVRVRKVDEVVDRDSDDDGEREGLDRAEGDAEELQRAPSGSNQGVIRGSSGGHQGVTRG
eukprot:5993198-Prymnesium_polylepis.1